MHLQVSAALADRLTVRTKLAEHVMLSGLYNKPSALPVSVSNSIKIFRKYVLSDD
jgi:hypothetical protein